jgi:predicted GNAT family N-acyltransferase
MNPVVKTFRYKSPEYDAALELRDKILRKPLGLVFTEDELKKDAHDIHMGLFDGDRVLACLTLTETPDGRMKMRQVAVDDAVQGTGLGSKLSTAAEQLAKERGFNTMFCHARKVAAPFYLKLGYQIVGDEFTEVNIPHYVMEKQLTIDN